MVISKVLGHDIEEQSQSGQKNGSSLFFNEPAWVHRADAADHPRTLSASASLPLRTGFQDVHFALLFGYIRLNNWYVEVVSKIEYLVFIHSTFYCVMHWANWFIYHSCNRTQHIICTKLKECLPRQLFDKGNGKLNMYLWTRGNKGFYYSFQWNLLGQIVTS